MYAFKVDMRSSLHSDTAGHSHYEDEFFFCYSGTGIQYAADRKYKISPGALFILPAGQGHCVSNICEDGIKAGVLMVAIDLFDGPDQAQRETGLILRELSDRAKNDRNRIGLSQDGLMKVKNFFDAIIRECEQPGPGYNAMLKTLTQDFLLTCLRHSDAGRNCQDKFQPVSSDEKIRNAVSYLNANFRRPVTVERVAAVAGMSRSHFHASFLKYTGKTMSSYLNRLRVKDAISRISGGGSLENAAAEAGFSSISNFYRRCKEHSGHPPGYFIK